MEASREAPLMSVLRGTESRGNGKLGPRHLEARDRALAAIDRAVAAVAELEQIEKGPTATEVSPRIGAVREIKGELTHQGRRLDSTYV